MRAKAIIRAVVALILLATITTASGCKAQKGATSKGRCGSIMEPNSPQNQVKTMMVNNKELTRNYASTD